MKKIQKPKRNGIYFQPKSDQSTHYVSITNDKIKDPYKYFQFPETHGFCQLFAFFLHINDVRNFEKVNFNHKLTKNNFNKYSQNSFQCLQKLISLLKNPRYKKVRKAMHSDFDSIDKKNYGIKKKATFNQFVKDLEKLTLDQAKEEMGEVFDMFVKYKETQNESFEKFWKTQDNKINKDLCVQPTTGESQYESFQAIIAYCFSADKDSPYVALLKEHDIELIEDESLSKLLQTNQALRQTRRNKRRERQQVKVQTNFVKVVSNFISSLFSS